MCAVKPAPRLALLAAILLVAILLRVAGWTWGLPNAQHLFSYHPDEYHSLRGFLALLSYDLNPHFFNYGSLYLYLAALFILLLHPGAALAVWFQQLLSGEGGKLLATWTLDARAATLVTALISVYLVYLLGRRLWGEKLGLLAAALVAILPLHVLLSHYATVDVTQTMFILLALYLSVAVTERPSWKTLAWAGAAAGLAASTKYNGLAVIVAPLLGAIWAPTPASPPDTPPPTPYPRLGEGAENGRRWGADAQIPPLRGNGHLPGLRLLAVRWGLILAAAVVAFALTSPYTFLAWQEARHDIFFELQHMQQGEGLPMLAEPSGWLFHLRQLLAPGMGPLFLLGIFGAGWTVYRRDRRCYPLVLFALVWLVMISLAKVRYPRYELPLAVLLTPLALAPLANRQGRGKIIWGALVGVTAALMLLWSGQIGLGLSRPDPRQKALTFLEQHSQPRDAVGLIEVPWFADPPLDYCNGGRLLRQNPLWERYQHPVRPLVITGLRTGALTAARPAWFVTTDFGVADGLQAHDPDTVAFTSALHEQYRMAAVFGGVPLALVPWRLGPDWRYPWPEITVWQRED